MSLSRLLRPRATARHASPSRVGPVVLAGGLTTAFLLAEGAVGAGSASAASADDFRRLRGCESGGNYRINTGNGFYGAYQFDRGTWNGLGYSGVASNAAPATQDAAARRLQAQRGWAPWPACSRKLGLRSGRASRSRAVPHRVVTQRPVRHVVHAAPGRVAGFSRVLTMADGHRYRGDVMAWQRRMAARGWPIAADGYFGPQSAGVATRFASEKRLRAARGTVNRAVYTGAWTLRVT